MRTLFEVYFIFLLERVTNRTMKKRRPTIPFASWKLTIDLDRTKEIQGHKSTPAFECKCDLCMEWKLVHREVIPAKLLNQLARIGVDLNAPTDLYGSGAGLEDRTIRVVFHVVGKIISGPIGNSYDDQFEYDIFKYEEIRKNPPLIIRVLPEPKSNASAPTSMNRPIPGMLCIDMRLDYSAGKLENRK